MDPTIGIALVVGFPVTLVVVLMIFGRFSVQPD